MSFVKGAKYSFPRNKPFCWPRDLKLRPSLAHQIYLFFDWKYSYFFFLLSVPSKVFLGVLRTPDLESPLVTTPLAGK